jgi:hypothetical protein
MGKAGRKHFMPGEQMAEYWKESVECGPEEPVIERLKEDSVEQRTGGGHSVDVQHRRADQEREGEQQRQILVSWNFRNSKFMKLGTLKRIS